MNKRICFTVLETERAEDGGYIACILTEDEAGYHRTDWNWGNDLDIAKMVTEDKNNKLGLTREDVLEIDMSTWRAHSLQRIGHAH